MVILRGTKGKERQGSREEGEQRNIAEIKSSKEKGLGCTTGRKLEESIASWGTGRGLARN